jgi:hypothetical protein
VVKRDLAQHERRIVIRPALGEVIEREWCEIGQNGHRVFRNGQIKWR